MSVAGGLHLAIDRIRKVKGKALQIFSRNQRQWKALPISAEERDLFVAAWAEWGEWPVAVHNSYLINLASPTEETRSKSLAALVAEIERVAALGISYLIMHPGSCGSDPLEVGLGRIVENLDLALGRAKRGDNVTVLLENTAGQGSALGAAFDELAYIINRSANSDRLGVCLDTCHLFASGYDFRTPETYKKTMEEFDRTIGIKRLKFFHLNDSKKELASQVDRHEHIGKGCIGLNGFGFFLNDSRFRFHPMTLETPKGKDLKEDTVNLRVLRKLMKP